MYTLLLPPIAGDSWGWMVKDNFLGEGEGLCPRLFLKIRNKWTASWLRYTPCQIPFERQDCDVWNSAFKKVDALIQPKAYARVTLS